MFSLWKCRHRRNEVMNQCRTLGNYIHKKHESILTILNKNKLKTTYPFLFLSSKFIQIRIKK